MSGAHLTGMVNISFELNGYIARRAVGNKLLVQQLC
jgi:hypothetical protein